MHGTNEQLFDLLLVALGVLAIGGLTVKQRLYHRLEIEHVDLWVELGRPAMLGHRSWREAFSGPSVIWSKQLAELSDRTTKRLVALGRCIDLVGYVVFALLGVLFVLSL